MTKFRPDYVVLHRIGKALSNGNCIKKTCIQMESRVNWNLFSKYMDWLEQVNFIKKEDGADGIKFVLTRDGREMFQHLDKFMVSLKLFVMASMAIVTGLICTNLDTLYDIFS